MVENLLLLRAGGDGSFVAATIKVDFLAANKMWLLSSLMVTLR